MNKPYIAKKGRWANGESKYVIRQEDKFIETVPKVLELLKALELYRQSIKRSQDKPKTGKKDNQKFSHELLNEVPKKGKTKTVTDEEAKQLFEMIK